MVDFVQDDLPKWPAGEVEQVIDALSAQGKLPSQREKDAHDKQQIDAGSGVIPSMKDEDAEEPITPITTEATMEVSAMGPSLRWTTFEDRIRKRREEVLESSIRQTKRTSGPTASERERKAS